MIINVRKADGQVEDVAQFYNPATHLNLDWSNLPDDVKLHPKNYRLVNGQLELIPNEIDSLPIDPQLKEFLKKSVR